MHSGSHPLRAIQEWMKAVMTHPGGINAGLVSDEATRAIEIAPAELNRVINRSSQMTSHDRLQIYQRAYFSRLIECLRAQYPSVLRALGEESFDAMAFGYLVESPSRNYTLAKLGDSFSQFLAATRPPKVDDQAPDFGDFLIELADLERTYNDVFHGSGPEVEDSLSSEELVGLSPDEFAGCSLVPHASTRLIEFRFAVHEYATAVRNGTESDYPAPRPVFLVISRRDYVVRRFEVSPEQFTLLSSIVQGQTIGQSLHALWKATSTNGAELVQQVRTWFYEWSRLQLFRKGFRAQPTIDIA